MDKLQQVIATIVSSPLTDQEKITWIQKFTAVTNPEEFKKQLDEISQYFDSFAEKYEDEVRLYDKYLSILEKFQIELAQVQQKQPPPIPPVAVSVSAAVTQSPNPPVPVSNWTPADTTFQPAVPPPVPSPTTVNDNAYQPLTLEPSTKLEDDQKEVDELDQIKRTIAQLQSQAPKQP